MSQHFSIVFTLSGMGRNRFRVFCRDVSSESLQHVSGSEYIVMIKTLIDRITSYCMYGKKRKISFLSDTWLNNMLENV